VQGVREATVEQIAALPGFSPASAQRILDALRVSSPFADAPSEPGTLTAPEESTSEEQEVIIRRTSDPAA
jgi:hypothetical protein